LRYTSVSSASLRQSTHFFIHAGIIMDFFTSLVQLVQTDASAASATSFAEDIVTGAQDVLQEDDNLFADGEKAKLGGNSYCVVV